MEEKFRKLIEIMKNNQVEMLEVKTSNTIKTTLDSIISRQDQTEEILSEIEDKIEEVLLGNYHKK
jgi:hypothetical protein